MLDPYVLTRPGTVLLDTARPDSENRRSVCFTRPERILSVDAPNEVPALVGAVEDATEAGAHAAGFLSYEAGYPYVDLEAPAVGEEPVAWFGVYDEPEVLAPADVARGLSLLDSDLSLEDVRLDVPRAVYTDAIQRIHRYIGEGEVYQINYTSPVRFRALGDPRILYRRLRQRQHVPYGAYLNLGGKQILSCSPELFFRQRGDRVVTRPMKGTLRRGRTLEEDRVLQEELASDPKNQAENLMIVDLLRNDLSVCCRTGSVEVPALFDTEPYDTVIQMTSTVEGRLQEGHGLKRVLRALFPCGSVTGAPKRRAMRVIRQLEAAPRGVYCGAIGRVGPDRTAEFNVAIRTVELSGEEGKMGVGSGIVWDSDPAEEYDECRLKAEFLTGEAASRQGPAAAEFKLIETMRFDGAQLPLLDRHVHRLARSATYFSFPFDEARFRRRVRASVSERASEAPLKVRATLDRWGQIDVTTTPVADDEKGSWRLTIADRRADREDPFFYHKTTNRAVYERALEAAQEKGCDEALLLNQDGEVTEGTHTNLFVRRGDALWTPPVESGLLAGVYRDYVLDTRPEATERVLALEDLKAADGLYCCNAVRGWREAELVPEPTVPD